MRKADYTLLASLIHAEIELADNFDAYWRSAINSTLKAIATNFASRAAVDANEFLKACGIK